MTGCVSVLFTLLESSLRNRMPSRVGTAAFSNDARSAGTPAQ